MSSLSQQRLARLAATGHPSARAEAKTAARTNGDRMRFVAGRLGGGNLSEFDTAMQITLLALARDAIAACDAWDLKN